MPFISVVVPFYKGEKFVDQAIDSVLDQPFKDVEVVLINDGSPTGETACKSLVERVGEQRVKYYSKANEGIGATRNRGIELATGDYLAFLDQDDVWVQGFLTQRLVDRIRNERSDIYCFSFYNCNDSLTRGNLTRMDERTVSGGGAIAQSTNNHHSSLLISSKLLEDKDVRYAASPGEDIIFMQRALYVAQSVTFIDRTMFLYRNNIMSETHRKRRIEEKYGPLLSSWKKLLQWHEEKHPDDKDAIATVKHMILVYAMEAVEALYQTGISEDEAEEVISRSLCRDYIENYQNIALSENRVVQVERYLNSRQKFIEEQGAIGAKMNYLQRVASIPLVRRMYSLKKYREKVPKGLRSGYIKG